MKSWPSRRKRCSAPKPNALLTSVILWTRVCKRAKQKHSQVVLPHAHAHSGIQPCVVRVNEQIGQWWGRFTSAHTFYEGTFSCWNLLTRNPSLRCVPSTGRFDLRWNVPDVSEVELAPSQMIPQTSLSSEKKNTSGATTCIRSPEETFPCVVVNFRWITREMCAAPRANVPQTASTHAAAKKCTSPRRAVCYHVCAAPSVPCSVRWTFDYIRERGAMLPSQAFPKRLIYRTRG